MHELSRAMYEVLCVLSVLCARFGNSSSVGSGRGVTVYTMDSGVRETHQEFQPWQGSTQRVSLGWVCVTLIPTSSLT